MIKQLEERAKKIFDKVSTTNVPLLPVLVIGIGGVIALASKQKTTLIVKKFYYK